MSSFQSLKNNFLIAMPSLLDPNFFHSVTYIVEHTEQGSMGLVINHPLQITLLDVLQQMNIDGRKATNAYQPIYAGGPIQPERGFVLHKPSGQWQSSMQLTEDIAITTSKDILEAIAHNEGPAASMVTLGFAGWDAGQLEQELSSNAWLLAKASPHIIFDTPAEQRWQHAAQLLLGVDITHISNLVGHA